MLSLETDQKKFEKKYLTKRNRDCVHEHICEFVPPLRHFEVSDLEQITYLKAWIGFPKFRDESDTHTWLRHIAHNAAIDYLRKIRIFTLSTSDTDQYGGLKRLQAEEITDPFDLVAEKEMRILYHAAIESYHPTCQAVLRMVADGVPYKEIAPQFGWQAHDVRNLVFAFRQRLRAQFREAGILQ
jgi:RNA polymerase sigma factor (sigma-70 family)